MPTNQPTNSFEALENDRSHLKFPDIEPTRTKATANERQVAGSHYHLIKGSMPQHWDLAVGYQWDFFQYQITKYVMRWKTKHQTKPARLEDLKKAAHFIQKYIEEVEAGRWPDDKPLALGPLFMPAAQADSGVPGKGYVNQ